MAEKGPPGNGGGSFDELKALVGANGGEGSGVGGDGPGVGADGVSVQQRRVPVTGMGFPPQRGRGMVVGAGRGAQGNARARGGAAGVSGGGANREMTDFCQFANNQLLELTRDDPLKEKKEQELKKRIEDLAKRYKTSQISGSDMAESIIQFLRQANPLALNIDFNEKFQLLRKQKIAAAAAAATAKGGLGPKSLPVMKQVMQKRPLGTAQDGTIKKARVDPQSKPSSSNRPPVRRKSTGAAGPQPPPQQQQQLQQPKQTVNPQQGQPEQQTSQPLQAQQASQSHQAQQASQPQQASAAPTTTTKPEGKPEKEKKAQAEDPFDLVKSAGIDVEGEEELLGLDAPDQEENTQGVVQEDDILSHPVLKQKLEGIASRYSLDGVTRECAEYLSLAVRERMSNFFDMLIRAGRVHHDVFKLEWPEGEISTSEVNIGADLSKDKTVSIVNQGLPNQGAGVRDCLFVIDQTERITSSIAQSMRWFARLQDISTSTGRKVDDDEEPGLSV